MRKVRRKGRGAGEEKARGERERPGGFFLPLSLELREGERASSFVRQKDV